MSSMAIEAFLQESMQAAMADQGFKDARVAKALRRARCRRLSIIKERNKAQKLQVSAQGVNATNDQRLLTGSQKCMMMVFY